MRAYQILSTVLAIMLVALLFRMSGQRKAAAPTPVPCRDTVILQKVDTVVRHDTIRLVMHDYKVIERPKRHDDSTYLYTKTFFHDDVLVSDTIVFRGDSILRHSQGVVLFQSEVRRDSFYEVPVPVYVRDTVPEIQVIDMRLSSPKWRRYLGIGTSHGEVGAMRMVDKRIWLGGSMGSTWRGEPFVKAQILF
ncbi:MAG: hypothetical protein D6746_10880 [Bacteroidetes bacterium]|nr:MAG: hypothetical protein D6746_10880 [Bacteroidota bacterium]